MIIARFEGKHRFLSNFYPAEVRWGVVCPTVEHAYQAAKALTARDRLAIANAKTAGEAKRLGKQVRIRPDWDQVKLQVMEHLLRQKFAARTRLADLLLGTEPNELVEGNTWGDVFWGFCDGRGENHLGRLLMKIRTELRSGT